MAEDDDLTLTRSKQLVERIKPALFPSLKAFEKKVLVTFDWDGQGKGKQSTSVILKEVDPPRKNSATVNFTLSWKPSTGKEVDVPVTVAIVSAKQNNKASLWLRIDIHNVSRTFPLGRGETILKLDQGDKITTIYPYPSSATGVERVGQVWYPRQSSDAGSARETGFIGGSRHASLDPYWPQFNEEEGWKVELPPIPPPVSEGAQLSKDVTDAWGKCVLAFVVWATLVQPFQQSGAAGGEGIVDPIAYGLPPVASYWPQRAVNLDPNKVYAELSKTLLLPWHLVAAACASLNAGKHLIFTGPPGCGKSKLAIALARMVRNAEPVISTASPAWTAGDLVGRYLPRRDGEGLEFKPGFFLRAAEANRCLVIDEFNRANIDQCFGELFAVFAGDPVELPFEQAIEGGDTLAPAATASAPSSEGGGVEDAAGADVVAEAARRKERYATVRILPATYSKRIGFRPEEEGVVYRDYKVSPEFRLVGTMNDADRAQLHQLSFALLRRFDILRVEAPSPELVKRFILEKSTKNAESVGESAYQFDGQTLRDLMQRLRSEYLETLFANTAVRPDAIGQIFSDLAAERVVGLATVEDILRFLSEGLRCPSSGQKGAEKVASNDVKDPGIAAAASYLAMGMVASVFPQLDALDDVRRFAAIKHIVRTFHRDGKGAPFVYIELKKDAAGRDSYQLVKPSARSFRPKDIDKNNEISTAEYLIGELSLQYKDIPEETWNSLILGNG